MENSVSVNFTTEQTKFILNLGLALHSSKVSVPSIMYPFITYDLNGSDFENIEAWVVDHSITIA